MSKPFVPKDPWTKTETLSCEPTDPVSVEDTVGQEVEPFGTMQTVPVGPLVVNVDGNSVSGSGVGVPFAMVRHIFVTLVGAGQPV